MRENSPLLPLSLPVGIDLPAVIRLEEHGALMLGQASTPLRLKLLNSKGELFLHRRKRQRLQEANFIEFNEIHTKVP